MWGTREEVLFYVFFYSPPPLFEQILVEVHHFGFFRIVKENGCFARLEKARPFSATCLFCFRRELFDSKSFPMLLYPDDEALFAQPQMKFCWSFIRAVIDSVGSGFVQEVGNLIFLAMVQLVVEVNGWGKTLCIALVEQFGDAGFCRAVIGDECCGMGCGLLSFVDVKSEINGIFTESC